MWSPNNTNSSETNLQYSSELHGHELSLIVAASVILILLIVILLFLWLRRKQQRRDMNVTDCTDPFATNCQRESKAAMELQSLPVFIQLSADATGSRDCAVCLAEIGIGSLGQILPVCSHVFHKECIDLWVKNHSTCPVCRADILRKPYAKEQINA